MVTPRSPTDTGIFEGSPSAMVTEEDLRMATTK